MVGKQQIQLKNHNSMTDIENEMKSCVHYYRYYLRLQFIKFLKLGENLEHICELLDITLPTGYNWLNSYNESGFEGLKPKFGGGRKSKLTDEQFKELFKEIDQKIEKNEGLSYDDVQELIINKFGVTYSKKQVGVILKKHNYKYSKAYPFLYKTARKCR